MTDDEPADPDETVVRSIPSGVDRSSDSDDDATDRGRLLGDGGSAQSRPLTGRARGIRSGLPVEDATVTLTTTTGVQLGQATTDAQGRFRMVEFGRRLREDVSTDRPDIELTATRQGQSVEVRWKGFDWNAFEAGSYGLEIGLGPPTEDEDDGQSSGPDERSTSGSSNSTGLPADSILDTLADMGPFTVGEGFPGLIGVPDFDEIDPGLRQIPLPCDCENCESAVSPAAYLTHLLRYATDHVDHRTNGSWNDATITTLTESFHQPFGRLPASCDAVTDTVRHARVATEVLLEYLDTELIANNLDLFGPPGQGLVSHGVVERYERTAYETLLDEWGVSLRELRRADYDEEEREAIAERVGIAPEHVNGKGSRDLFLDPDANPIVAGSSGPMVNDEAVTQRTLEELFGLPSLTEFDPQNGVRVVQDPLDDVAEPAIEQWRRTELRERWREQDHEPDPYPRFVSGSGSSGPTVLRSDEEEHPAIDPDVVGPDDIREPTGNGAGISVWRTRREWVDDQLETFWADRPDVDAMVGRLFQSFDYPVNGQTVSAAWTRTQITVPLADDTSGQTVELKPSLDPLVTLQSHLSADETDTEALTKRIRSATGLDGEAFDRLATLADAHRTEGTTLAEADLWETASLLVTARKRSLSEEWIEEERNKGSWSRSGDPVQLGPEQFWHSQREPDQGPWSSRLDAHDSGGLTEVATGTLTTPDQPGTRTIEVGFDPDVIVFTATVPGAANQIRDGRSDDYGVVHGAAQLQGGGTVTQHALRVGEAADGSATGVSDGDAVFTVPVTVNGSDLTVTGAVTGRATGGFELDIAAPNLGPGSLPSVVVGYRAYRAAESASLEVGHFRTKASTGTQTVQFGVDADLVSLTASSLVDGPDTSATSGTVGLSRGQVAGGTDPDQTVVASTIGGSDGVSYTADTDAAIDILYRNGGGLAGRTTATARKLDGNLTLDFDSVYDGQHNPGDARKLVTYAAVDTGDDIPRHETHPSIGHFETPTESGTVEIETGFEPALVEFTVCTAAGAVGSGSTTPVGWTEGTATADGQHGLALAGTTAGDGHAALGSTTDAIPVLYADDRGQVSGRETGHVSLTGTGFTVQFPVTATAAESAAPTDQVLVFYRAWPAGVPSEPYVDPERIDRSDLPEVTAGGPARRLYDHRQRQLDARRETLEQRYENASGTNPFDAVLDETYGASLLSASWAAVFDEIAEAMEVEERDAGPRLRLLRLSREEFETLRATRRRARASTSESPSDQQLTTAFGILVTAWKRRDRYPSGVTDSWVDEEQSGAWIGDADSSVQPADYGAYAVTDYWAARKAALPTWRSDRSSRQTWQQSLEDRGRSAVLNPDVIGEDHIAPGNATAMTLLTDREAAITLGGQSVHPDLSTLPSLGTSSFHATLESIVGIDTRDIDRISRRMDRGEDVSARLRQLDLSYETFEYLLRVHEKVDGGHPVSDTEWANVRQILVEVWKRRTYGRWRREELADDVFVDPGGFELPDEDDTDRERDEDDPVTRWRRHLALVREWEDTLETRIEAFDDVDRQISEAVAAAEEAALPAFRDELVTVVGDHLHGEVTSDPSIDVAEPMLDDLPQLVSERLLIDVEMGACRETTRVSQATTTIQRLLERLHRRYSDSPGPVDQGFRLKAELFEQVWNWLGTYPKWKAAIGVYLYPENAVLPTMRERRTPAFRRLEKTVQTAGIGQLTTDTARTAAEEYSEYMWDMLSLVAQDGSLVEVELRNKQETTHLGYVFGQGVASETVYYRAFDPSTDRPSPPGERDGLWKPVPPLSGKAVDHVVGACTYDGDVYVFAAVGGDDQSKLGFTVFDTDEESGTWEEFSELSVSGGSQSDGDSSGSGGGSGQSQDGQSSQNGSDSKSVVAAAVARVQGSDTPPEVFVQLGHSGEWKEIDVFHGVFDEDGDPPDEFEQVTFGLYDLHYSKGGELDSKPNLRPPYRLRDVVRCEEEIRTGPSTTWSVWAYNVYVEGDSGVRVYTYRPGDELQPDDLPSRGIQDTHHFRQKVQERLWNQQQSTWKAKKRKLEDIKQQNRTDYEKYQLKQLEVVVGTDFTDNKQIEVLANELEALDIPRGYGGIPARTLPWTSHTHNSLNAGGLRQHLIDGDWAVTNYNDATPDYVLANFDENVSFAVDGSDVYPDEVGVEEISRYPVLDGGDGPNLRGSNVVVQLNNSLSTTTTDVDNLTKPVVITYWWSQFSANLYLGNQHYTFEEIQRGENFYTYDLGFASDVVDVNQGELLAPIIPRPEGEPGNLDWKVTGPWLTGVTIPLDDGDVSAEKRAQYDRTETMFETNFDVTSKRTRSILPYLEEAYFQMPLLIARQLSNAGEFEAALDWFGTVYDYTRPEGKRKLWYYLRRTPTARETRFDPETPWLADPMRPHQVARTRTDHTNPYTVFTQLSLIQCLIDFGDEEFSRDTPSSVAQASSLYKDALDVLDTPELAVYTDPCERAAVSIDDGLSYRSGDEVERASMSLAMETTDTDVNRRELLTAVAETDFRERYRFSTAVTDEGTSPTEALGDVLGVSHAGDVTGEPDDDGGSDRTEETSIAGSDPDSGDSPDPNGASMESVLSPQVPSIAETVAGNGQHRAVREELLQDGSVARAVARVDAATEPLSGIVDAGAQVTIPFQFCVPSNPWPKQLRREAESNLEKIRTCRNIAGMRRELEPYAASTGVEGAVPTPGADGGIASGTTTTVQPTRYRYSALIQRAKELVNSARQIETEYLAAIEKMEQEEYKFRKARQDVELSEQRITLQQLRIDRARGNVELARLQRERSRLKIQHYGELLSTGRLREERRAIEKLERAIHWKRLAFGMQMGAAGMHLLASAGAFAVSGVSPMGLSSGFSSLAAASSATASVFSTEASIKSTRSQILQMEAKYRRRAERWRFQRELAQQSARIDSQKIEIAREELGIARQRHDISELKAEQARDMVNYLSEEQFTNRELYQWMSGVLGRVYRYFLQEAAATAKLAERQLAFQRQATPPGLIQSGYWAAPSGGTATPGDGSESSDRRGLTGSVRLKRDIERLDQHAMETARQELEVEKTIALSELDPIALQQFRETGVLSFATPMELFDRDAPGRYRRLIDDVSVSIIALTQPTKGINATLRTSGNSWVVVGDTIFQKTAIRRDPQSISLDRARGEEREREVRLTPSESEMLRPFENSGVETEWELRMPKAANQFDYDTIADVLLTIEYSALESHDYRRQVQERLDPERVFDRVFSVKNDLGDEWYELNNPGAADEPMTVTFETERDDFPPNISNLAVDDLALNFVAPDGDRLERVTVDLAYSETGATGTVGGEAAPVEGLVATPSASTWNAIVGKEPVGEWTLSLPDSGYVRRLFEEDAIEDMQFVVSIEGEVPAWPA